MSPAPKPLIPMSPIIVITIGKTMRAFSFRARRSGRMILFSFVLAETRKHQKWKKYKLLLTKLKELLIKKKSAKEKYKIKCISLSMKGRFLHLWAKRINFGRKWDNCAQRKRLFLDFLRGESEDSKEWLSLLFLRSFKLVFVSVADGKVHPGQTRDRKIVFVCEERLDLRLRFWKCF